MSLLLFSEIDSSFLIYLYKRDQTFLHVLFTQDQLFNVCPFFYSVL